MSDLRGFLGGRPLRQQFSVFLLVWGGFFLLSNFGAALVLSTQFGFSASELLENIGKADSRAVNTLKLLQLFATITIFAIPALVFAYFRSNEPLSFLEMSRKPSLQLLLIVPLIMLLAGPVIYFFLYLNQNISFPPFLERFENYLRGMETKNEEFLKALLEMGNLRALAFNMVLVAVAPAIAEELLFRGVLQRLVHEWLKNIHVAIFLTGALFSFIHFQFFGFVPRMLLGVLFGYLFYWSGNLWLPIFAHFVHNGLQVLLLYLYQSGKIETDIEHLETFPWQITVISTIVLAGILVLFIKLARRKSPTNTENNPISDS